MKQVKRSVSHEEKLSKEEIVLEGFLFHSNRPKNLALLDNN